MSVMQIEVGSIVEGKVTGITKYGAFVALPEGKSGMIHISEISSEFVKDIQDFLTENQQVRVKIIGIDENGKIALSIKRARVEEETNQAAPAPSVWNAPQKKQQSTTGDAFEDMMTRFKAESDEKISALRKSLESKRSNSGFGRKNTPKH